ncbi:MAG TPA: ABC transporter ATP-binding protein/permease, partial [Burkholderiaceae bacterium]
MHDFNAEEWTRSLIWIIQTWFIAGIGFVVATALVARLTHWGRQFWALARPYFDPRRSRRPLAMLALILLLSIASVRLDVVFSYWNNGFYDSIQSMKQDAFWFFMKVFGLIASLMVLQALIAYFVAQAFEIHWRSWMNDRLTDDWLADDAFYRAQFVAAPGDNPDQRIQVDIGSFVNSTRTLALGAVSSIVSLVTFTAILWGLSGPLPIAGVVVPRGMVFLVYLYVLIASVVAFRLGRPLIRLSFMGEKLSADFRYALIRLREYAENIAFYHGEANERQTLAQRFAAYIANLWAIVFRTLKFDGFNLVVTQTAVVFPFLIQAPRFFSGAIKLGDVIQTAQAFGQVHDALSFFRNSYDGFAGYRAVLDRLSGFVAANATSRALPRIAIDARPDALAIEALQVRRPNGALLVQDLNLALGPGRSLLVQGASGVGKTTLLRALAGLWPYVEGKVQRPVGAQALFLPQRPYLPLGSLRTALAYPGPTPDDDRLRSALQNVQLGHLQPHLDEVADWSGRLSLGEQ